MIAVGIDWSISSTGLVMLGSHGFTRFERIQSKPWGESLEARAGRMRWMVDEIAAQIDVARAVAWQQGIRDRVGVIVYEGPAYGSTNQMGHMLGGFWWMLAEALSFRGPVAVCQPTSLKKFATGDGSKRTQKPQMVAAAARAFPDREWRKSDHDIADAAALAMIGALWLGIDCDGAFASSEPPAAVRWPDTEWREEHVRSA